MYENYINNIVESILFWLCILQTEKAMHLQKTKDIWLDIQSKDEIIDDYNYNL